jgi:hypothetical protein
MKNQITILSDILSPTNLAVENKRKGSTATKISKIEEDINILKHMHNGKHPDVP